VKRKCLKATPWDGIVKTFAGYFVSLKCLKEHTATIYNSWLIPAL